MWTYAQLAAALVPLAALRDADAAKALAAATVARRVAVPTSRVLSILLKTGDWGPLVLASRRQPTGDATADRLVSLAIVAVAAVERTTEFGTERDEDAQVVETMVRALESAVVLSKGTADRLLALMHVDDPVWNPAPTALDVARARKG